MRAKCKICGSILDTNNAYKVVVKGKNAYYCSCEEYNENVDKKKKEADEYYAVENAITEIFGYKVENSMIHKEWKRWNNISDNCKIADYLNQNKSYLCEIMRKEFSSEYGKIRYFSTILCNNLKDFNSKFVVKETEKPKVKTDENFYNMPSTSKNKRRSLADLEDDF